MGSCFRWKKKNSYTVTHDEEYSISGGKYNPHREPYVLKSNPELAPASSTAAKKWAAESRNNAETNQSLPESNARASISDSSDRASLPVTKDQKDSSVRANEESVKENGFHRDEDSHSDRSSPSIIRKEDEEGKLELKGAGDYKQEQVEISYEQQEKLEVSDDNVSHEEDTVVVEVSSDIRPDSPTREVIAEPVVEATTYEIQTTTISSKEEPIVAVQTYDNDSDADDREDILQAREEYLRGQQLDDEAPTSVVNEFGEEHITDSPAGTWDARLNRDVCAEIEEHQRSSLGNSKSNSEASLDAGDKQEFDPDQRNDHDAVVQHVQFDLSNERSRDADDVNIVMVSNTSCVIEQSSTIQYEGNETYTLADGSQLQEKLDNDINAHLATGSAQQYGDESPVHYHAEQGGDDDGVIELSDEIAVSYEEPYSSSGQVDVIVHGSSP